MPVLLAGEPKESDVGQNRPAFANEVTVATSLPASTTVMEQSVLARRASAYAALVPANPAPTITIFIDGACAGACASLED